LQNHHITRSGVLSAIALVHQTISLVDRRERKVSNSGSDSPAIKFFFGQHKCGSEMIPLERQRTNLQKQSAPG
jgi:hypothetical protein